MTIIYEHEAPKTECYDTRYTKVEKLWYGDIDIEMFVGERGEQVSYMRHNLSISEADRLGFALCKDMINNYKRHAANLKDKIAELESLMVDMQYDNIELQHKNTELEHKNTELEYGNKQLEQIISTYIVTSRRRIQ